MPDSHPTPEAAAVPVPREVWNGRPPVEHEGAPAHLLENLVGRQQVWEWEIDCWWIGGRLRRPDEIVPSGWSYVAPLYPAPSPAAPPQVETVRIPVQLDDHHPLLDAIERAWSEGEGFLGQYGARKIWADIIADYGSKADV